MRYFGQSKEQFGAEDGHPLFMGRLLGYCVFLLVVLMAAMLMATEKPGIDNETTVRPFFEKTLGLEHDELIMLAISLIVAIEVIANFRFFQRLPRKWVLLSGFGCFVLSAFFTVAEGIVFESLLNYLEHFSYMVGAILLAIWCACVFGPKKKERV